MEATLTPTVVRGRRSAASLDPTRGMILIHAGSFLMGSETGGDFESPVHKVYLDDYWIEQTPVTNEQFGRFVDDSGYLTEPEKVGSAWGYQHGRFTNVPGLSWKTYATPGRHDHPVVLVTWN